MNKELLWKRFQTYYLSVPSVGFSLDISRMNFKEDYFKSMDSRLQSAFADMETLEKGAIANPDEKRMVGHYWLRAPDLAPNEELKKSIKETISRIKQFAKDVHDGKISSNKTKFKNLLLIGIGGSALGPQFVSHALGSPEHDKLRVFFFDNTDPDGMDLTLSQIYRTASSCKQALDETLTIVVSKSGSTKETRNGQLEAQTAYEKAGLSFATHAVAVTGDESELSKTAVNEKWISQFPMWDWVGGRTSELSAVGLLPAALQGIDIDDMLKGACLMDVATRSKDSNMAAILALMWYYATNGKGEKDMVVLPYKDRLLLFSRYLQQLVMESLGKEKDLDGNIVDQGIAVYGNKGSTDQHAYIQQLREGVPNFFVTFIEVLKDRNGETFFVEPNTTSGDYLNGFLQGTREALYEKGRESITLTIPDVSPKTVGALIALYERAVGFYASLIRINAYHQPGVEAGKKAATAVLMLQEKTIDVLQANHGKRMSSLEIAKAANFPDQAEMVFHILRHLASNSDRKICSEGSTPGQIVFWMK